MDKETLVKYGFRIGGFAITGLLVYYAVVSGSILVFSLFIFYALMLLTFIMTE